MLVELWLLGLLTYIYLVEVEDFKSITNPNAIPSKVVIILCRRRLRMSTL